MFHQQHTLFEYSDTFQDFKQGADELPTTTHSSPNSLKSNSLQFDDSPFNCSFDEGNQSHHAQAVWNASITYLQSALKEFRNLTQGLNDHQLFNLTQTTQVISHSNLEEIILQNDGLKIQQKHEFISDLHNEPELFELLKELAKLFTEDIFHEITFAIYKIWEKKKENEKFQAKNTLEEEPLIPHFDCFWGYEEEEVPKICYSPFFDQKSMEEVIESADKCADQIGQELFFDSKLKLINLRECQKVSEAEETVASLFGEFFKTLARSVFLSAEGFFTQNMSSSDKERICEEFSTEDLDFEMNEISALEEFSMRENRFVRSFSQIQEDDEEEFDFSEVCSKKRKLQ